MRKLFGLCSALMMISTISFGQVDYDEIKRATDKVLIQNVIIHDKPGSTIEYGSILIKDGIILQVGKGIKAGDAMTLMVDSLHVYPAFIDALSHTGFKKSEEGEERPKVKFTGAPPDDVAGILPERSVMDLYSTKAGNIASMREAGFGISHIAPEGNMLPGQSAIITLSGKGPSDVLIKDQVGMFAQLKSSRGVFPATMIGVLSKFKELYRQAQGAKIHLEKYQSTPQGMKRPYYSNAINAFIPVTTQQQKVFFKAQSAKDVHRVLALKRDLGFQVVLTDVKQVYPVLTHIKKANVPLLLSLDLPKKPEEKKSEEDKDDKDGEEDGEEEEDKKEEPVDEEKLGLEKRKAEAYAKYIGQYTSLEKAGVSFGFSWIEAKPKNLQEQMATLIEAGLSEKSAISGLTTVPAQMLGISNIAGTLEKGKLGNLLISTKPIFEKDAKIKFMLVDGEIFEYEIKEKKKKSGSSDEMIDLFGSYDYEISMFEASGVVKLKKDGDEILIEISDSDEPDELLEATNVERDGNNVSFDLKIDTDGGSMDVSMSLDFEEDGFEGSVNTDFGAAPIEGNKINPNHK